MRRTIRQGVFETNSSNTHAMVICLKEDFDKWKEGKALLCPYSEDFLPVKEARKKNVEKLEEYVDYILKSKYSNDREKSEAPKMLQSYRESTKGLAEVFSDFNIYFDDPCDYYLTPDEYDDYYTDRCLEDFYSRRTLNGADVVAFGYSGREG